MGATVISYILNVTLFKICILLRGKQMSERRWL